MSYHDITGIVGGIQKFSTEDGPGIRTTVFLKGCPLQCRWCHNPELIDPKIQLMRCPNNCIGCRACEQVCPENAISFVSGEFDIDWEACSNCMKCVTECWSKALNAAGRRMTVDEVMDQVLQDKDFYQNTNGGVTISGGELLTQPKFAKALLDACERNGIGVALDTCGYGPAETLLSLAGRKSCTHILFDLKQIDSEAHRKYTGVGNEIILRNLAALARDPAINPKLIMRMPLISGVNDSLEDIQRICKLFQENGLKAVTLLPYHELGVSKRRNIGGDPEIFTAPTSEQIGMIGDCFRACGVSVEILGA